MKKVKREATAPPGQKWAEKSQLSRPPIFRLHCRPAGARPLFSRCGRLPAGGPPSFLVAGAACRGREGDPGRPQGGRSAAAGADITRPERPGRFAPTPRTTRGGRGTARLKRQISRSRTKGSTAFPHKGEYGGAGGVEGIFPSHPMPRAGQATRRPRRAEAAIHRGTPAQYDQDVLPFSTLNCSIEHFQFEMLCISNHTVCRFAKKRFSRSLGPAALAPRVPPFSKAKRTKNALSSPESAFYKYCFRPLRGPSRAFSV